MSKAKKPAPVGEPRAWYLSPEATAFFDALEVARASPVGAVLDELALHDLVNLEMWVPRESKNEHAQKTMECCAKVRAANQGSMKANYWLRRAMVYSKDFMLFDDAIRAEPFINQSGKKELKPKTKLYEEFAALYPGDNKKAVEKLRFSCPDKDDGSAPFFWRDREVIERETDKRILIDDMISQLQKARQRMKIRSEKKT